VGWRAGAADDRHPGLATHPGGDGILLQRIVDTGSEIAIIDITGVPTVDTLVAQHLLKTVTAIRLMGADCIISGVRPQIAQTIVHLGLDLQGVVTKANLADALKLALTRLGISLGKAV
jgi:rsbT co-antagonist protein RsbR